MVTKLLKRRVDTDALRLFISRHVPLGRRLMSLLGISVFKPTEVAYLSDLLVNAVRREGPAVVEAAKGLNVAGEDMTNCLGDDADNIFDEMINTHPDIDDETLSALALNFVTHGIEEVSAAAARAAFELHRHTKAQKRLSTQIDQAIKNKGSLDFDELKSFDLMESLILESLRRYPNVSHVTRNCSSQSLLDDLLIEPGVKVNIPISGMSIDSKFYPAPDQFKPRRFLKTERRDKNLAFGLGARKCPGQNFAMLVAKSGLAALLARFELVRSVVCDPSAEAVGCGNPYLWVEAFKRVKGAEGESSLAYMRMSSIEFEEEEEEEEEEEDDIN